MNAKRSIRWLVAAAILVAVECVFSSKQGHTQTDASSTPVVRAVRASTPPVIDGKLDDPCWQEAQAISNFRIYQSGAPSVLQTTGYVCFDDKCIYVGMKCPMLPGVSPKGSARPHDSYMFQDDIVEIMLDPGRTKTEYRQFCVNAFGATYDTLRGRGGKDQYPEWNGDWTARAYRSEGFYSVEAAFPFYTLGVRPGMGKTWGLNLTRDSVNPAELSSIAIGGAFNEADKFALLEGISADLSRFAFEVGEMRLSGIGTDEARYYVPVRNMTGATHEVQIALYPLDTKTESPIELQTVTLAHRQQIEFALGRLEMKPLFQRRNDLYIVWARPTKVVISDAKTKEVCCVGLPGSPPLCSELLRLEADEPWSGIVKAYSMLQAATLTVTVTSKTDGKVVAQQKVKKPGTLSEVKFDIREFPWGAYELCAVLDDAVGKEKTSTTTTVVILPTGKHAVKPLNNLVSELMNAGERGLLGEKEIPFMNPRDGWCFFRLAGDATISLDSTPAFILKAEKKRGTAEGMRLLPAGRHTIKITGRPETLIVRAIPALMYNVHETGTHIAGFGVHTWERLSKHILPNCNMIESHKVYPETAEWRAAGKLWIANYGIPKIEGPGPLTPEAAYQHWQKSLGYSDPQFDGMQIDEYGPSTFSSEGYIALAQSVAMLAEDPKFQGRQHIPFACSLYKPEAPRLFMKAVLASGWPFSEEWYIAEQPTEQKARETMIGRLVEPAQAWEASLPGSVRRMIVTLMYSALPYCTCNTLPTVDFKVHLDMQMETLANAPVFRGLYGVQPYRSNYVDPDTLHWMGRLLRHYCIEGRRERLSKDPYELRHILNPDFDEGGAGWHLDPAEPDSITFGNIELYGMLEGRYGGTGKEGNHFALTRRSDKRPNILSQEIRNLTPGRLYSLKMYTGDHQDLRAGRSRRAPHAISIEIDNVDMLPGPEHSFQSTFRSAWGRVPPPFSGRSAPAFYMNFHWRVFRAKSSTATLRISDWQDPKTPGGPVGQEIMYNFIEVQPYIGE